MVCIDDRIGRGLDYGHRVAALIADIKVRAVRADGNVDGLTNIDVVIPVRAGRVR
jgi:hypothetical protein